MTQNKFEALLADGVGEKLRCDTCGQFIALTDFEHGATRRLVTPDSHFTREEYATECVKHAARAA